MAHPLFSPDSAFSRVMDRVGQLAVLNVLWLVCSLPVVTLGASSTALYTVLLQMEQQREGHVARRFWAAFRENFRQATMCFLPVAAFAALCAADLLLVRRGALRLLAMMGLQVAALECTMLFPMLARYENTWKNQLVNAFRLAVGWLPRVLLIWSGWAVPVAVTLYVPYGLYEMLIVWVLVGYAAMSYFTVRLLRPVFAELEQPK